MIDEIKVVHWFKKPENVIGFTTQRSGGVSSDKYQGLNLGVNTSDNTKNILKNYKILSQSMNLSNIVIVNQVHGSNVLEVTKDNHASVYLEEADGLFTIEKNIGLGIQTADCFPVLLAGNIGIAALHCGWRSLNGEIIENALRLFKKYNDYPKNAYIGPGICKDCYEIREDMLKRLNPKYKPEDALVNISQGVYKFDLRKEVSNALKINSIENIEESSFTSCHSHGFYSYRRDFGDTGRMLSVVVRK